MNAIDNPSSYYSRSEVSNSDLTELKSLIYPRIQFGDKEKAFRLGSLVDAMITEPERVDFLLYKVDDVQYCDEEFLWGMEMRKALRMEAKHDPFLQKVLQMSDTQKIMINKGQQFSYCDFQFQLDTRCKWDWWMPSFGFGGDLKTTFASSKEEFEHATDFFDWDRSRAWYMDIAGSDRDFIYAISKKNFKIFKLFIKRGDEIYNRGREKYEELAFRWWLINPINPIKTD